MWNSQLEVESSCEAIGIAETFEIRYETVEWIELNVIRATFQAFINTATGMLEDQAIY
jgi:hypothetical protein